MSIVGSVGSSGFQACVSSYLRNPLYLDGTTACRGESMSYPLNSVKQAILFGG
jgi:hypothetical protein